MQMTIVRYSNSHLYSLSVSSMSSFDFGKKKDQIGYYERSFTYFITKNFIKENEAHKFTSIRAHSLSCKCTFEIEIHLSSSLDVCEMHRSSKLFLDVFVKFIVQINYL